MTAVNAIETAEPSTRGSQIRNRIEANRQRRLSIAEAMKAEAGVTSHTINEFDEGGVAYLNTGVILSPEGRNMRQLHVVAHECGHIFLHRDAYSRSLPTHVKEMEAEMYANQAFMAYGMRMPAELLAFGRSYVGSWIEKDRLAGWEIDAAAQAYAKGERSPYEPLRKIPRGWRHNPKIPRPKPIPLRVRLAFWRQHSRWLANVRAWLGTGGVRQVREQVRDWAKYVSRNWLYGAWGFGLVCSIHGSIPGYPEFIFIDHGTHARSMLFLCVCFGGGVAWAFVASMLRTMWK